MKLAIVNKEQTFFDIKDAVNQQLVKMERHGLYRTDVDKDLLWQKYLDSFPSGTNPIFRERTEHDCSCCRHFVKQYGGIVSIIDNKIVSIWDINIGGYYQIVADALSEMVKTNPIDNFFLSNEKNIGTDYNHENIDGNVRRWDHFHHELDSKYVRSEIGTVLSNKLSDKNVLQRSLNDITLDSAETIIELIDQGSLYRGEEHKSLIKKFIELKKEYDISLDKELYCWVKADELGAAGRIKNTVIGTLLSDLSEGKPLDIAVTAFEAKVAPQNYKRPTSLITKSMIDNAQKKVEELGIEKSLERRFAVVDDITINNVLFADRSVKKSKGVFDDLKKAAKVKPITGNIAEVSIDEFVENILPKAESIELLVENKHNNNLVSLIAPVNLSSPDILKWGNNFSWSYNGEVADSIKDKVKKKGGNVDGVIRCSLSWFNYDDLDLHCIEPGGNHVSFRNKNNQQTTGRLDVDMNAGHGSSRDAVENITWTNKSKMQEGVYKIYVNNYTLREHIDIGFIVEIEHDGKVYTFNYDKKVSNGGNVIVAEFEWTRKNGLKMIKSLMSEESQKQVWGLTTQTYHPVKMIMLSPNYWDGQNIGNKHWFFVLDGCLNPEKARGFYNEFLSAELNEHRKVFEVLSSKMKTPESTEQLSGLGFSSTQRNHVLCKVSGNFNRVVKINF